jgi:hypothetical protein
MQVLFDFIPALRDGVGSGNADPGFRFALPWAIFTFSLPGETMLRSRSTLHFRFKLLSRSNRQAFSGRVMGVRAGE